MKYKFEYKLKYNTKTKKPKCFKAKKNALREGLYKPRKKLGGEKKETWQRPTLPLTGSSTIGAGVFYFRVREGNGYFRPAMATRKSALP